MPHMKIIPKMYEYKYMYDVFYSDAEAKKRNLLAGTTGCVPAEYSPPLGRTRE